MFKTNGNKILKITLIISVILIAILIIYTVCSIINKAQIEGESYENNFNVSEISSYDYTNFLKKCHENLNDYINMNIKITGYVYRLPTFENNQFVIARTMILDSNSTAVVVGILSKCESASNYQDGDWVTVTGTIEKGYYNGEMPMVNITDIFKCNKPEDEYVYPPSA